MGSLLAFVVSPAQFAGDVLQCPLVYPMPLRGGRLRQWVPEEPEVVAAIVVGEVGPGVGRVVHLSQMKCPDLVGVAGCPQAQVHCDVGGMQPAFFAQFTHAEVSPGSMVPLTSCRPAKGGSKARISMWP